ncbi:MAG: TIGR01777 family protein [Polyangiaceae bacterium]|nr:TIGR01777 family protein [Polyangiaceae bacterium]
MAAHDPTEAAQRTFVLSGASGLVGSALAELLEASGHKVLRLVRRDARTATEVRWDPGHGEIEAEKLHGAFSFIHLSGENVGEGRWTDERKRAFLESRTKTTDLVARTIASMDPKPASFVSASAVGYYGFDRNELADESAKRGGGFLAELCDAWEAASAPAKDAGVRTVNVRLGVVLSKDSGALAKMLPIFRMGGGGSVGGGRQIMSWISLGDAVRGFHFAAEREDLSGPVNLVAPNPVDNRTFAKTLGAVLHRPAIVPVPAFALELAFGQMARETVLASQNVTPKKLLDAGFEFEHPHLEDALRSELGRWSRPPAG